jgi:hypothetical protein
MLGRLFIRLARSLVGAGAAGLILAPALSASGAPPGAKWQAGSFRVGSTSPVLVTSRQIDGSTAYVAWIDHTRTRLALYPGIYEPPGAPDRGPAQIPAQQRWRLLATFNGGFKASSGPGGYIVNGRVQATMQLGLGTLVEYRDGSFNILQWLGRTRPDQLVLARQNLQPLVWAGRPSPSTSNVSLWGATLGGGSAVWRTAAGVTRKGDLLYVAAPAQTPSSLAHILIAFGAERAIELDINPQWATFIGYRRRGARDPVALVPNPQQSSYRYLQPDKRDFFAVYTRAGGGANVPYR